MPPHIFTWTIQHSVVVSPVVGAAVVHSVVVSPVVGAAAVVHSVVVSPVVGAAAVVVVCPVAEAARNKQKSRELIILCWCIEDWTNAQTLLWRKTLLNISDQLEPIIIQLLHSLVSDWLGGSAILEIGLGNK